MSPTEDSGRSAWRDGQQQQRRCRITPPPVVALQELEERLVSLAATRRELLVARADSPFYGNPWFHCYSLLDARSLRLEFDFCATTVADVAALCERLARDSSLPVAVGRSDHIIDRPWRNVWTERPFRLFVRRRLRAWTAGRTLVLTRRSQAPLFIKADEIASLDAQGLFAQRLRIRLADGSSHVLARRWYFEWADLGWEDEMEWCAGIASAIAASLGLTGTVVTDAHGDFRRLEVDHAIEGRAG